MLLREIVCEVLRWEDGFTETAREDSAEEDHLEGEDYRDCENKTVFGGDKVQEDLSHIKL